MLIAIGLTTVVLVGVPVLLYSMDILSATADIDSARIAAEKIHNETTLVDNGLSDTDGVNVYLPRGFEAWIDGADFIMQIRLANGATHTWARIFNHSVSIVEPPQGEGEYWVEIMLVGDTIEIAFYMTPI